MKLNADSVVSRPRIDHAEAAPHQRSIRRRDGGGAFSFRTLAAVFLVLLTLGLAANALLLARYPGLGPTDSVVYADALDRALDGQAAHSSDTIGADTVAVVEERGILALGAQWPVPGNGVKDWLPPDQVPSTAYVHPPSYFLLTAVGVKVVQTVAPEADWHATGRLLGAVWAALGGTVLVALAMAWRVSAWPATSLAAWLVLIPQPLVNTAFVTPSAATLLVSSLVLLGVTLWWQRRIPWYALAPLGVLTVLFKSNNIVIALLGAVTIITLAILTRTNWRDSGLALGGLLGGTGIATVAWRLWADPVTFDYESSLKLAPDITGFATWLATPLGVGREVSMVRTNLLPQHELLPWLAILFTALMVFAALWCVVRGGAGSVERAAGAVALIAMAGAGLMFALLSLLRTGVLLPAPGRYVLPAIAFAMWPLLLLAERRWVWVTATVATSATALGWLLTS